MTTQQPDQLRAFADATCALRASHGQAPAGAAHEKVDPWGHAIAQEERACRAEDALIDLVNQIRKTSPVDDHGHLLTMNMAYIKSVQLLDSAASTPTAQVAPAAGAVAGPVNAVAYLDIGTGGYLDIGTDLTDEALLRLPKGRHALVIAGTYGVDGYAAAPKPCVACNGSGRYDSTGSPKCSACNGTGKQGGQHGTE